MLNATSTTHIALIQRTVSANLDINLQATLADIKNAASQGAQIICTQELFRSHYFCQTEDHSHFALAETIPGPSTTAFSTIAKELEVVIVASLFEKRADGLFHNTAVVFDADGTMLGRYRKMHIPDDPLFFEKFYFTPGDLGFKVFDTRYGKVGVLICWDQWFPEAARLTAIAGAEIIFYPTAIGWHPSEKAEHGATQYDSWETIQRSHAIANGVYVASVNRVGHEGSSDGGIEFWGQSFICEPNGTVLTKASVDENEILIAECDFSKTEEQRVHWPFLRDRRTDAYGDVMKQYLD